jgi:hypothetical protein
MLIEIQLKLNVIKINLNKQIVILPEKISSLRKFTEKHFELFSFQLIIGNLYKKDEIS